METVLLSASKWSNILKQKRVAMRQTQLFGLTEGEQINLQSGTLTAVATVATIEYGHPNGMAALVVSHIIMEIR